MEKFNIVKDAARINCKMCNTKQIEVFMSGKEEVAIACRKCSIIEFVGREEFNRLFD